MELIAEDGDDYLNGYNYDSCCWTGDDGNGNSQEGKARSLLGQ